MLNVSGHVKKAENRNYYVYLNQIYTSMLNREKVIETIKQLPDNFPLDEFIERIILLDKIETGLQQSSRGQVTPDEKIDEKLPKWLA